MFFLKPSNEIEIATSEITTTFLILERFDALIRKKVRLSLIWLYLYVCIRSHACPSIGRSVGLSVYCVNVKTAQNCRSWLQSFFLSPSHFRSLSLTFTHLHSLSLKCSFIKNVHSYILNQPGTHIRLFFSVENKKGWNSSVTLLNAQSKRWKKARVWWKKGRVYTNTCASRSKKEWMNEWMNEWVNERINGWMNE